MGQVAYQYEAIEGNKRVRHIDQKQYRFQRRAYFNRNVKMASAMKSLRTAAGVTQRELAEQMGCHKSWVGYIEGGHCGWSTYWAKTFTAAVHRLATR